MFEKKIVFDLEFENKIEPDACIQITIHYTMIRSRKIEMISEDFQLMQDRIVHIENHMMSH